MPIINKGINSDKHQIRKVLDTNPFGNFSIESELKKSSMLATTQNIQMGTKMRFYDQNSAKISSNSKVV